MTEQDIFEGIARRDNRTFLFLYEKYQGSILRMVQRNSGREEDALDVFQEGVLALWTNIREGKFELKKNARISTYLYALCRNIWISKLRKKKQLYSLDEEERPEIADKVQEMEENYERIHSLEGQLKQLSDKCQKLLRMFYYQKAPLREIARIMDITEPTAKNNKYRCMKSLRERYDQQ